MHRHEQMDWLDGQAYRDPRWADTEMAIRRRAVEIVDRLLTGTEEAISLAILVPSDGREGTLGFRQVLLYRGDIIKVGGLEQILLVEEIMRRGLQRHPEPLPPYKRSP